jgi:hypothetical protein
VPTRVPAMRLRKPDVRCSTGGSNAALTLRRTGATPTTRRSYRGLGDSYSRFGWLVQSLVGGAGGDGARFPTGLGSNTAYSLLRFQRREPPSKPR